ncbi:PQQ-binding-like beta-propeller repeat protein [Micromonospora sagamiensis]|uniref:Putative pyrroloquinoline-quinone binding quinoprotein n=1 Tax=Micromonospora sagamiensis TaxID=47875 RepID=A0A562WJR3_9ACTN|nr:PQQ-binding-like beta-propeller repeat protein [Micromonospora sagamiensis]TWJ30550.1 putative pyrroloquinoline-quinone binding quinoprotein [Micromonospora sagamiensis]
MSRRWRFALVLGLVLVTLAGAAPAPRRFSVTVPGRLGAEAFLVGDQLVVVGPPSVGASGDRELAAYDLPASGRSASSALRARWRRTVPDTPRIWPVTDVAGVLLVASNEGRRGSQFTVALETTTGRERWRQPGSPMLTEGGRVLLTVPAGEDGQSVRVVDPATGAVRWSASTTPDRVDYRFAERGIDRLVWTLPSGRTEVRDADSGRVLAAAPVHTGSPDDGVGGQVVDDLLLAVRNHPPTVTAYGLDRLDRHWTAELPSVGYVSRCGAMLCVWQQTGGVRLLDRATGRTVWHDPRWMAAVPVGDRLVATTSVSSAREEVFVLDAATGRQLADLGTWSGLQTPVDGRPPVASRQIRDRGLLVAEFDVVRGRPRILDVLPGTYGECRFHPEVLLCQQADGSFRLWWLRH